MDIYEAQRKTMRYFREQNGLSQCEVSRRTMICLQSIWGYEHKYSIPLDRVKTLCDCFGITLAEWFVMVDFYMRWQDEKTS